MSDFFTASAASAETLLRSVPERITRIQALSAKFTFSSLREAEAAFLPSDASANSIVSGLVVDVREEAAFAIDFARELGLWIRLSVPTMEDGNNFGVDVMLAVYKLITDEQKEMTVCRSLTLVTNANPSYVTAHTLLFPIDCI
jgi:hypothetical protein